MAHAVDTPLRAVSSLKQTHDESILAGTGQKDSFECTDQYKDDAIGLSNYNETFAYEDANPRSKKVDTPEASNE